MLEEGALPEQVDKVMIDFGYPMGPFAVSDLVGLDISYDTRKRRAAADPNYRKLPSPTAWSRWAATARRPAPAGIATRRATARRIPTEVAKSVITEVAERARHRAAHLHRRGDPAPAAVRLGQRGLQDPRGGQGLPRQRHRRDVAARLRLPALSRRADVLGRQHRRRKAIYNQIADWHQRYGARWAPSALLRQLAESGTPLREAKGS